MNSPAERYRLPRAAKKRRTREYRPIWLRLESFVTRLLQYGQSGPSDWSPS